MHSLRLLSTLLFCSLSNALAFPAPAATDIGVMAAPLAAVPAGRMEPRAPEPTPGPNPHWIELQKKSYTVTIGEALIAPDNTLGYYTSAGLTNVWGAYTCGRLGTAVLVFPNTVNSQDGYFACCYTGQCTFAKTCIDSSAYFTASACNAACRADTATYRCTDYGSEYCNLLTFSGIGVSLWACADETSDHVQLFTTTAGQTGRIFKTTNLVVTPTGTPPPSASQTDSGSGGLSGPAKIGVGVGAGVGGVLAIAGLVVWLVKAGVFSAAGAGVAAGAAGAGGTAASGGNAPGGDMTQMAGKMGFTSPGVTEVTQGAQGYYGYTPGGEATNFSQPPPGYAPTGTEGGNFTAPGGSEFTQGGAAGAGSGGYGPTGGELVSQGGPPAPGYGGFSGPTGAEGTNFTAPGGPTGSEGTNFSAPGNPSFGPTGAEGGNFTAPGGASGVPPAGPSGGPSLNPAYFAIPAAVAPLAAGAALLSRRKQVGSPVSSPTPSGSPPPAQMQPSQYMPPNSQYELGGGGVYHGSELGTPEASYVSPQSTGMGSYISPQSTGTGSYAGHISEMGTPSTGYAPPAGPPPSRRQDIHEMDGPMGGPPAELGGYYDPHEQQRRQ